MLKDFDKKQTLKGLCFTLPLAVFVIYERIWGKWEAVDIPALTFSWICLMISVVIWSIEFDKKHPEAGTFDIGNLERPFPHPVKNEPILNAKMLLVYEYLLICLAIIILIISDSLVVFRR